MKKVSIFLIFIFLMGCSQGTSIDVKDSISFNSPGSSPTIYKSLKNGDQIKDFLTNYLVKGKLQATVFEWGELIESQKYDHLFGKMKKSILENESYFVEKYFSSSGTKYDLKENTEAVFNFVNYDEKLGLSRDEYSDVMSLYSTGERKVVEKSKAIVEIKKVDDDKITFKGIEGTKYIKNIEFDLKSMNINDGQKTVFKFIDNISMDEKGNTILFSFTSSDKAFHVAQRKNGDIILNYTILNFNDILNINSNRELLLLKWAV